MIGKSILGSCLGPIFVIGCCSVPDPRLFFDQRQDPLETWYKFQYCLEVGEYDHAYDCLSKRTQTEIPHWKFVLALRFGDLEIVEEIDTWDLILNARYQGIAYRNAQEALIQVEYQKPGESLIVVNDLRFVRENPEQSWRFALYETLVELAGTAKHSP